MAEKCDHTIYGYCRVSTQKQEIQRQVFNILHMYPSAVIITEEYTGTTTNRPKFKNLLSVIEPGDTIVFDEVSRMSRNAKEGYELYQELYKKGVNLVFLKQQAMNTETYTKSFKFEVKEDDDNLNKAIYKAINEILNALIERQIEAAFQSAEDEVTLMHQRTREGVLQAKAKGKQIGRKKGTTVETEKIKKAKGIILKYSRSFGGQNTNEQICSMAGISHNTLAKLKRELKEEQAVQESELETG